MINAIRGPLVRAGFALFRALILNSSDRTMIRFFKSVRWLLYLITADKMIRLALSDVIDIFASGPPNSTTLRKIVAGSEPELIVSIVKCMRRPTPYGA